MVEKTLRELEALLVPCPMHGWPRHKPKARICFDGYGWRAVCFEAGCHHEAHDQRDTPEGAVEQWNREAAQE